MDELQKALNDLDGRIQATLDQMQKDVEAGEKERKSDREELKAMLKDWHGLKKDVDKLKDHVKEALQRTVGVYDNSHMPGGKTVGQQFVESEQFKAMVGGMSTRARVELKNTILTGGDNSVTTHDKLPGVVPGAFRALTVLPTVMTGVTSSNIVYFSRELLWTNNAAGQTEGATKAESVLTFEEVNEAVQTIAHFIKASRQALDDSDFLASYIDARMGHGVDQKVEAGIISGDGTGTNLNGWLATGNNVATDPMGTVDIYGLANKMKYEVIGADYVPDFYYFNPQDWSTMETSRRGTGDKAFVGASGAVSYVNNGLQPLLWGLPVIASNAVPQGTIICKSRDADMYARRMGTVVEAFEQDDTNVTSNLITFRGETRGAELNFTPAAIRTGSIAGIT